MKITFSLLSVFFFLCLTLKVNAQGPGEPYNPATANGAENIYQLLHILRWENPSGTIYNKVYCGIDSMLVANQDSSVLIADGYSDSVFHKIDLTSLEPLRYKNKYYWKVVEFGDTDSTEGPVWYFKTYGPIHNFYNTEFLDDFESYTVGQQLACQNPSDWTTWSNNPCGFDDPFVSTTHSFSGSKSVLIIQNNDLVKLLDEKTTGAWVIAFQYYIPSGKNGYFAILSEFANKSHQWGAECYFHSSGQGELIAGTGESIYFSWEPGSWQIISILVDLDMDYAILYDGFPVITNEIFSWQWSQGGLIDLKLDAVNFYGENSGMNMYIDDFTIVEVDYALGWKSPPKNLQAYGGYENDTKVLLEWLTYNDYNYIGYKIYRKNGLPLETGEYEIIADDISFNTTSYVDSNVSVNGIYTYYVESIYSEYPSNEATAYIPADVPVELISFTANVIDDKVELKWTTATELNNKGFEIERLDGKWKMENVKWEKAGYVEGKGTTAEVHSYSFIDNEVTAGKHSYRLKQIDYDGSFEYSNIVEVEIGIPDEFSLEQNYPNPFNPTTTIKFTIPGSTDYQSVRVRLTIYDILGNKVQTLINEQKQPGVYEVDFNASNLSSGIYYYRLITGDFVSTKKMILLR